MHDPGAPKSVYRRGCREGTSSFSLLGTMAWRDLRETDESCTTQLDSHEARGDFTFGLGVMWAPWPTLGFGLQHAAVQCTLSANSRTFSCLVAQKGGSHMALIRKHKKKTRNRRCHLVGNTYPPQIGRSQAQEPTTWMRND